jgi:hypothetical protein
MSAVRVYLPLTAATLRRARDSGRFGPAPLRGHAVTPALVAALDGSDEEEQEHAAATAAALDALALLHPDDPPRRMVAAVDVPTVEPVADEDVAPSQVVVAHEVPLKRLAAVLADSPDAERDVADARAAVAAGGDAAVAVERCLEHELGWYAAQEIGVLLDG